MPHSKEKPTERFLLIQRLFTFLDEWLFYGVALYLYHLAYPGCWIPAFWIVAVLGSIFIIISYAKQWHMEAMRFEKTEENEP